MKIGILQTGHLADAVAAVAGDYDRIFGDYLSQHGFEPLAFPVVDGVFPQDAAAADGWLITGSRHGAYEAHDWIPPLEDLIRDIHAAGQPMVGICFGHQIIAQALGGKVEKFEGGWSIGRQVYSYKGREMAVSAWHQDQVTKAPEGAETIAHSSFCANAGFVIGDHILTIQPHPEFSKDLITALLEHRARGLVPDDLIAAAAQDLPKGTDRLAVLEDIAAFLRQGAS